MLVVDPAKRITVAQIKQHRWMLADPSAPHQALSLSLTDYNSNLGDYSEPVLGIMQTLGIDRQRTVEVSVCAVFLRGVRVDARLILGQECWCWMTGGGPEETESGG